jgi:hypothetical protein
MRLKVLMVAACAISLATPAVAPAKPKAAKPLTLTGKVVGSAYPSGSHTAVPVLLDARPVRRARLRGPLAVVLLPRNASVRIPGTRTPVLELRAGDVFRLRVRVRRTLRRALYPALKAGVSAFAITRRGTVPSAAELQRQLDGLNAYVGALTGYVLAEFADLRGQLAGVRAQLGELERLVRELRPRLDALDELDATLKEQISSLLTHIETLQTQVNSITTQLTTLSLDATTIQEKLVGIAPGDLAGALSDVSALEALVGGIDVSALSDSVGTLSGKLGSVTGTDLQTQVATIGTTLTTTQTHLTTAQAQVAYLCASATSIVAGNPLLLLEHLQGCPS